MSIATVFRKELVRESRSLRTYPLRTAYVVFVFALVVLFYANDLAQIGQVSDVLEQQGKLESLAVNLYRFTAIAQIVLAGLLTPILVTAAFQSERQAGTLELLTISRLTDQDVVLGKVAARYLQTSTLILSGLPILTLIKVFGYVNLQLVLSSTFNALVVMLLSGALAAYYGMRARTLPAAIGQTYGALILLLAGTAMAGGLLGALAGGQLGSDLSFGVRYVLNPILAQFEIIERQRGAILDTGLFALLVTLQTVLAMLVSWFVLQKAEHEYRWWRLGLRSAAPAGDYGNPTAATLRAGATTHRRKHAGLAPKDRPEDEPDTPESNAMDTRDRGSRRRQRIRLLTRSTLWIGATVGGIHMLITLTGSIDAQRAIMGLQFFWIAMVITVVGGAGLAQEQEDQTLAVLLTTPLTTRELIAAKLREVFRPVRVPYLIFIGTTALAAASARIDVSGLLVVILALPIVLWLLAVVSISISATMRDAGRAVAYSVAMLLAVTLGTWMIGMLISAAGDPGSSIALAGNAIRGLNPFTMIIDGTGPGTLPGLPDAPRDLTPGTQFGNFGSIGLSLGVAAAIAAAATGLLFARFQRWVRANV